jgi:SAM-dependent methyltransferase
VGREGIGLVVDVGCGGRPYEAFVAGDARYLGLDLTPSLGSAPDLWATADAIPLADASADLVLCTQVLEHVPDPQACVSEMARILVPGGRLLVTAPQNWNLHEAPHDYFRFTRYGLEALCAKAGLEVLEVRPQGGLGAAIGIAIIMYLGGRLLGHPRGSPARSSLALRVLRWPLAAYNLAFALLDGWSGPGRGKGAFAVNHLVLARKTPRASTGGGREESGDG